MTGKAFRLSDRQFLFFCVVLYLSLSFSLFLSWPVRWPDEVHFADISRTFAEEGHLGTKLISGMEQHVYWQPPLYFFVSAAMIKLGGFHLEVLRMFSVLLGAGILWLTGVIAKRASGHPFVYRLSVVLLAVNPLFVNYAKLARMDGLCLLLILLGVHCVQDEKRSKWIAGLFFALASMTHFMGGVALVIVASYWLLLSQKSERRQDVLALIVPTVLALGAWSMYILQDPDSFLTQIKFQFERKSHAPGESFLQFLVSFRSVPLWWCMMVLSIITSRWNSLILILLVASLFVVSIAYEFSYHLYVLPFATVMIALLLVRWKEGSRRILRQGSLGVPALLLLNVLLYFGYCGYVLHFKTDTVQNYEALVSEVEQRLAPESKVLLSGYPSLFWGLKESQKNFRFMEAVFLTTEMKGAALDDVQYIVFTRTYDPVKDSREFLDQLATFTKICSRKGKELKPVAGLGVKQHYVCSAEVFEIVPAKIKPRLE